MQQPLLTTTGAADYMGLKPQTLRTWRSSGKGPAYIRLGSGKFARAAYSIAELDRWLAARTFTSTSDESVRSNAATAA